MCCVPGSGENGAAGSDKDEPGDDKPAMESRRLPGSPDTPTKINF